LHEAARDHDALDLAALLAAHEVADRLLGLLARRPDERAGVEHDRVRRGRVIGDDEPFLGHAPEHQLGVDEVARAT